MNFAEYMALAPWEKGVVQLDSMAKDENVSIINKDPSLVKAIVFQLIHVWM